MAALSLSCDTRLPWITCTGQLFHSSYHNTTQTNEYIATTFNYNTGYLSQMMKDYTGKSLHQYLISYRLKIAKENLITTDDSINTITWKSGFPYFKGSTKNQHFLLSYLALSKNNRHEDDIYV